MKRLLSYSFEMWILLGCLHCVAHAQGQDLDLLLNPYPETGAWDAKDGSRTGFFMEVQNGILAGAYFGADAAGDNVWLIFSGQLQPVIGDDGLQNGWLLESPLRQTTAGGCILDCAEADVADPVTDEVAQIRLEFSGRSQATFSVDDNEPVKIFPAYWGNPAFAFDPEQPNLFLPNLTGIWLSVSTQGSGFGSSSQDFSSIVVVGDRTVSRFPDADTGDVFLTVSYPVLEGLAFTAVDPVISCDFVRGSEQAPNCSLSFSAGPMQGFGVEFDSITDSRFSLIGIDDVLTVTRTDFFRLNYD
ncbi:MAG: hypothetical protein KKC01_06680 [Gammaproteobacteria bacterium]|nr:hypothetical protein [Gammaproteobacteria bacterium]